MATTIGNLAVMLTANTSQFSRGISTAGRQTQSFSVSVERSMGSVMRSVGRLSALVTGGGIIAGFVQQFRRIDEISKTAARLGLTTEQLTRLQFAAGQTGVSVETFNMALQRMTRRVAEAAMGTGEAQGALQELGLDAAALSAMGPGEAFRQIADAMQAVPAQADRVRLAMKLFDSEGVRLVNTLGGGSAALDEFGRVSDSTGNTVNQKLASSVEKFNDTMDRLKVSVGGVFASLSALLIPALQDTSVWLARLIEKTRTGESSFIKITAKTVAFFTGLKIGLAIASRVVPIVQGIVSALRSLSKGIITVQALTGQIPTIVAGLAAAAVAVYAVDVAFDKFEDSIRETADASAIASEDFDSLGDSVDAAMGDVGAAIDSVNSGPLETMSESVRGITSEMDELGRRAEEIFNSTRTPAERLAASVAEIAKLSSLGLLTGDTSRRALEQLQGDKGDPFGRARLSSTPDLLNSNEVSFAAMGASDAAGRREDRVVKNTGDEVEESRRQTRILAELLQVQRARGVDIPFIQEF